MLNTKKYAVYGNCQAPIIAKFLNSSEQFSKKYVCVDIPGMHEMTNDELLQFKAKLPDLSLFIYQNVQRGDYATPSLLSLLDKNCIRLPIPSLFFNGYNPEVAYIRQSRSTLFYHDRIMLNYIDDIEKFIDLLKNDFFPKNFSMDCFEASITELEKREKSQQTCVTISDFIRDNYQTTRLFHVLNHPTAALIQELSNRILLYIGMHPQINHKITISPLDKWQFPIYQSHYNNLGLQFNNELIYYWAGNKYSIEDFFKLRKIQYNSIDMDFAKKDIFDFKKPIIRGWDLAAELQF